MKSITLIIALKRLAQCLLIGSLLTFAGTSLATERVTYYHNDALGSPVAATDASGTLLWREEYAPYGERLKKEAGSKDTVWYTGKQEESTFGISYFGARWYDPAVGRFTAMDPLGFSLSNIHSFSKYAYANNNPYLYVDPDGRQVEFAPGSTAKFKNQVGQMIKYLNKGKVSGTIAKLHKRPEKIILNEGKTINDFKFDPGTSTITIHPLSGLNLGGGSVQTPALGLLHEADHALQFIEKPKQLISDMGTPVTGYNNAEEKRVIDGVETSAANKLGEPTRKHHGGRAKLVKCPTCAK